MCIVQLFLQELDPQALDKEGREVVRSQEPKPDLGLRDKEIHEVRFAQILSEMLIRIQLSYSNVSFYFRGGFMQAHVDKSGMLNKSFF